MSAWVAERAAGCSAVTLDGYLRGLGLLLLAELAAVDMRGAWAADDILVLYTRRRLDSAAEAIVTAVRDGDAARSIRTPWRGKEKGGVAFAELRNAAEDDELAWFDACALPRDPAGRAAASDGQSDKSSNPLLLQGGQYRIDIAAAYDDALAGIRKAAPIVNIEALLAILRGEALSQKAEKLVTRKKALGAYQSGRATGPGHSALDVNPSDQQSYTACWDVVLVVEALSSFRGVPTRRPASHVATGRGARERASFPLVVRARAAFAGVTAVDLREDPEDAFEFLAPLWRTAATGRSLRHAIVRARLRSDGRQADDTADAALIQAARGSAALGFDTLVRYAFIGSGAMLYALRRGSLSARGSVLAQLAHRELVPPVKRIEREVTRGRTEADAPVSHRLARRQLNDAIVALASPDILSAKAGLDLLRALHSYTRTAAYATQRCTPAPSLSGRWWPLVDDRSRELRLARSLLGAFTIGGHGWLRSVLAAESPGDQGVWQLDPFAGRFQPSRSGRPLAVLVNVALRVLRIRADDLARGAQTAALHDLAWLVAGWRAESQHRRIASLTEALASVTPFAPTTPSPGVRKALSPVALGIGEDVARLVLASRTGESVSPPRHANGRDVGSVLVSLLNNGSIGLARVTADRELRRRGLTLSPPPLRRPAPCDLNQLALALLLPLEPAAIAALETCLVTGFPPSRTGGTT